MLQKESAVSREMERINAQDDDADVQWCDSRRIISEVYGLIVLFRPSGAPNLV